MQKSLTPDEFIANLGDCGLFTKSEVVEMLAALPDPTTSDSETMAEGLIAADKLTPYQAAAIWERRFGELVIGNYHVLDRLGAGAMGTVYKARHRRMKRIVAVKVLSQKVADNEMFVKRFQREVEVIAKLNHPNIVMAFDADEAEIGHFLVMEFVEGQDLASMVEDQGPLPLPEAVECIAQAARAMDYAHQRGVVHRDIKPHNMMKDIQGLVKVADLGLARINDSFGRASDDMSALTQAGTIMGTVDYMPPEQALGLPTIDHRADIYSLGCSLYYLIIGKPPFRGATMMATMLMHREAPIPKMKSERTEVSTELDAIFERMIAKQPEDRFSSMGELAGELDSLLRTLPKPTIKTRAPMEQTAFVEVAPAAVESRPVSRDQTVELRPASDPASGVLLVEPSRSQALIIRGFLAKLGYPGIQTVPSGEKALEAAQNVLPQVVISSMQLTDMTGVQLAQKLRAVPAFSSTGFILITSQTEPLDAILLAGTGTMVRLTKPFDMDQLAMAMAHAAKRGGDRRVLIVDDSAAARAHIRAVLMGLGLQNLTESHDGIEAKIAMTKSAYDLVVTDYNMPRLDGRGLVEFIRQQSSTPNVPIVMVTTETNAAKLEAVRKLGVSAIVDKSFKPDDVRGLLEGLS